MKKSVRLAITTCVVIASVLAAISSAAIAPDPEPPSVPDPVPTARLKMAGPREFTPREYLWHIAPKLAPVLDRVARCESGWKMIPNSGGSSTAYGYFQILDGTARLTPQHAAGGSKRDPYTNVEMAVWLAERDGVYAHWFPSYDCWKP